LCSGMRYDIWDELVRPIFEDRMEIIADYPATSLLPSETHISRKAIFAGTFPDFLDTRRGEDALLKEAIQREFGYDGDIEVVIPMAWEPARLSDIVQAILNSSYSNFVTKNSIRFP
jgi:PglZ domain